MENCQWFTATAESWSRSAISRQNLRSTHNTLRTRARQRWFCYCLAVAIDLIITIIAFATRPPPFFFADASTNLKTHTLSHTTTKGNISRRHWRYRLCLRHHLQIRPTVSGRLGRRRIKKTLKMSAIWAEVRICGVYSNEHLRWWILLWFLLVNCWQMIMRI